MFAAKVSRPYFDAWLRRTGRQLAASGRLTQIATSLAATDGGSVEHWRASLRELMDGDGVPSLDLLTKIDALLAGSGKKRKDDDGQAVLVFGL